MARFDHLDPLARRAVAIARDHQAFERTRPMILDRLGHRAAGFAGTDDDSAAPRLGRKMRGQALRRQGRADRCIKHAAKQRTRIDCHYDLHFSLK